MQPQPPEPHSVAHLSGSTLILPVPDNYSRPAGAGPRAGLAPQRTRLIARFNGRVVADMDLAGLSSKEVCHLGDLAILYLFR